MCQDYESLFGLSKKQIRDAFVRLEDIGVIRRVLRSVETTFGVQNNVLFIELFPEAVRALTHKIPQQSCLSIGNKAVSPPLDIEIGRSLHQSKEVVPSTSRPLAAEVNTYTKITPEITAKTTQTSGGREEIPDHMMEIWHRILQPSAPLALTEERSSRFITLLRDFFQGKIELWEQFCQEITQSAFLMGKGQRGWRVTLDWILDVRNLQKTLEGNYRDTETPSSSSSEKLSSQELKLKVEQHLERLEHPLSRQFCRCLLRHIPEQKLLFWFGEAAFSDWEDSRPVLSFPSRAVKDYVERHFSSEIGSAARSVQPQLQDSPSPFSQHPPVNRRIPSSSLRHRITVLLLCPQGIRRQNRRIVVRQVVLTPLKPSLLLCKRENRQHPSEVRRRPLLLEIICPLYHTMFPLMNTRPFLPRITRMLR